MYLAKSLLILTVTVASKDYVYPDYSNFDDIYDDFNGKYNTLRVTFNKGNIYCGVAQKN